ncbi:transposase [Sunxiuqinia sp. sy24]|uniref:transposase n=1 Tax=Sunxiuqinia sp. sy24 TaxID=3461495 RepID=UPI0040452C31
MDKFQHKYRIPSARLQNWDYGSNASYFVSICTHNRACYFGHTADQKMVLSETGDIARHYWLAIPNHFAFIELGAFVIMPNHVHGILIFNKPENGQTPDHKNSGMNAPNDIDGGLVETPNLGVSTTGQTAAASEKWKPDTLGVIINQYKRAVTINARKINSDFAWQSRFHDHIIRNDQSLQRISNYIRNNPANWKDDQFNPFTQNTGKG